MWTTKIVHSQVEERLDADYYHPRYLKITEELERAPHELKLMRDIRIKIIHPKEFKRKYVGEDEGILFLRAQNIRPNYIDLTDKKYVSKEIFKKLTKSHTKEGDIVIVRTGVNFGDTAFVPKELQNCGICADILRIVLKKDIDPMYVSWYLNSRFGRLQLRRRSIGAAQKHINVKAVELTKIPIISQELQIKIAKIIQQSYERRSNKVRKSQELLDSLENFPLKKLRITRPKIEAQKTFAVKYLDLEERLDVHYYRPMFLAALKALEIQEKKGKYKVENLGDVVDFSRETIKPTDNPNKIFEYIEIADVSDKFGKIESVNKILGKNAPSRARRILRFGDIIVATLKGTFRKIAIVPKELDKSVGTTGFAVLKAKNVDREFLHAILRTTIVQKQLERQATGAIMPAVTQSKMKKTKIPVPSRELQNEIKEIARRVTMEAEKLRVEADSVVEEANKAVERMIIEKK